MQLEDFVERGPGYQAAMLLSAMGEVTHAAGARADLLRELASYVAGLWQLAGRVASDANAGVAQQCMLECDAGHVVIQGLTRGRTLLVLTQTEMPSGALVEDIALRAQAL